MSFFSISTWTKKFMSMSEKTFIFQRKPEKWKRFLFRMVIIQFNIFPCFVTSISFAKHTFAFLVPWKEFLFCISSVYFFHSRINNCKKKKQFTRVAYCILIIMFIWFLQVLNESFSNSQCGAYKILHQKTKSDTEYKTHLNAEKASSLDGFQLISRFCYFCFSSYLCESHHSKRIMNCRQFLVLLLTLQYHATEKYFLKLFGW